MRKGWLAKAVGPIILGVGIVSLLLNRAFALVYTADEKGGTVSVVDPEVWKSRGNR